MARQQIIGKKGEDIAVEFLTAQGYLILERNWRIGKAEIDIIAKDGNILVFAEVKSRAADPSRRIPRVCNSTSLSARKCAFLIHSGL